ncbi:hypothetical protein DOM21_14100 [Bacteriovorax stolpii]|uniref:hypothetical protein n=1 Tax=Bacteriovorax stolpii TaxID=960 RepID=UPI00115A38EF|nr:hypothetical protein [Bacteriovorax stolpii]QDK42561.1 hypothetical protein DOM21_14100 [Bacteriovorax stolpii]
MKTLFALTLALGLSSSAFAGSLNENALQALLNTKGTTLVGDVHSYETVASIYKDAVTSKARINNECHPLNNQVAHCTLWINYNPIGETALTYEVALPGHELLSDIIEVARGD